jgi:predicted ATPase/DNA-binding winged helix-turn-helix (wHTH) protein
MLRTVEERSTSGQEVVSFGPFQFVPRDRRLTKQGEPVKLGGRALNILHVLLENEGEVVGHKELMARVWQGVFVEEVSLRVHMAALRKALDTGESGPRYLTNVPGRGYCFAAKASRTSLENVAPLAPLYLLPAALSRIVGREEDVREICKKIAAERLVTVAGPGGIGKTTVALAVGHALLEIFGGAVCFVDLSRVVDPNLLARTVTAAFGLPVNSPSLIPSLVSHFRARRTLLILDNCEHLALEAAVFAEQLLAEAVNLHILATSREILRAADECVHRLASLESPPGNARLSAGQIAAFPSVKLFVDRLTSSGAAITLDDSNAAIIGGICHKLGGIALAIELAAGSVGTLGLKETASHLDSQIALRWPGRRTAPPRHQTMSATLDWSYNLLSGSEKKVLRRLAVFAGGFAFSDVRGIVADAELSGEDVNEAIAGLLAKSLATGGERSSGGYRLLETTRAYAALKLREAGEESTFHRKYTQYFRDLLFEMAVAENESLAKQQSGIDIDNIRGALRWAFGPDGDLRLAVDLAAYSAAAWVGKGLFAECADWMARAMAALTETKLEGSEQQLLIHIAATSCMIFASGFSDRVREEWVRAVDLAISLKNVHLQMFSLLALWAIEERAPRYRDSLVQARNALEVAKQSLDPGAGAMAYWMMGTTERHLGRLEDARTHLQRVLDTDTEQSRDRQLRDTGYDRRIDSMVEMSSLLWLQGFPDQARNWGSRAIDEARELGLAIPLSAAMTWPVFNKFLLEPDIDAVERDTVELLEHARTHTAVAYEGFGLCILGLCQTKRAEFETAKPLVAKGLELLAESHYGVFHTILRTLMCEAAIHADQLAYARALMTTVEAEDRNPEHWCKSEIFRVKGLLAVADGNLDIAEALFLQSIDLAHMQGALSWELRSVMDFGKLYNSTGRTREALEVVTRVYGRFTEGFETLDLHSARRLIDDWTAATQ